MVTINERQLELETKAKKFSNMQLDPSKTPEQLFGPQDDWILTIDHYRLLLVPGLNQWWYYDRPHESWEFTGHLLGEVFFSLKDGYLDPPKKKLPILPIITKLPTERTILPKCPSCHQPLTPGKKFCSNCGTPIETAESPKRDSNTCPKCGGILKPGATFCRHCGNKIQ